MPSISHTHKLQALLLHAHTAKVAPRLAANVRARVAKRLGLKLLLACPDKAVEQVLGAAVVANVVVDAVVEDWAHAGAQDVGQVGAQIRKPLERMKKKKKKNWVKKKFWIEISIEIRTSWNTKLKKEKEFFFFFFFFLILVISHSFFLFLFFYFHFPLLPSLHSLNQHTHIIRQVSMHHRIARLPRAFRAQRLLHRSLIQQIGLRRHVVAQGKRPTLLCHVVHVRRIPQMRRNRTQTALQIRQTHAECNRVSPRQIQGGDARVVAGFHGSQRKPRDAPLGGEFVVAFLLRCGVDQAVADCHGNQREAVSVGADEACGDRRDVVAGYWIQFLKEEIFKKKYFKKIIRKKYLEEIFKKKKFRRNIFQKNI